MMNQRNTMMKKKPVAGGFQKISPKVMAMIVLLAVMGILWGRVLLKGTGGPATAEAPGHPIVQDGGSDSAPQGVPI